ncbi:MAG: family 10 glycosylhydrolase [Calditrichaeota bacterium]|nr:family 10 glycosylhydrolase [Calditrichota bacterium]
MHPHTGWTNDKVEATFRRLKESGIDAVLFLVYNGRKAFYESDVLPVESRELERLLPIARKVGLELHAWMFSLICNVESVIENHPDWFVVNREGISILKKQPYVKYYKWLCPNHTGVQDFLLKIVSELTRFESLAGIHLDYIRYPDVILPKGLHKKYGLVQDREYPQFDYCYCPVCRDAFQSKTGQDPLKLPDPSQSQAWRTFREEAVTALVDRAARIIKTAGKQASAAVFATPALARKLVRQNWPEWSLDAVFPMIYHNAYAEDISWIFTATREGVEALHGRMRLYSGIFVPKLPGSDLAQGIADALRGGADGVSFFPLERIEAGQWSLIREKK